MELSTPQEVQTLYPKAHRPVLLASLSFTVSHQVKPNLRCEVSYPGTNTPLATLKDLHVTCKHLYLKGINGLFGLSQTFLLHLIFCAVVPPKDVKVQVQTLTVLEGGSALLVCSCKADPPASEYRWSYSQHGRTVHLHQRTHTIRLYNVTRDMRVRCSAQNLIGRGDSRQTLLDIQCNVNIF